MDEIGKILPSLFRQQIRREQPHLLEILVPLWPRIAGRSIAEHSQPSGFVAGVLTLNADCTTWCNQLKFMAEEIRTKINGFLGQPIVKKLRINPVTQHGLFHPPQPSRKTVLTDGPLAERAMDTTSIPDPAVALALANSYTKYFNRTRRKPSA